MPAVIAARPTAGDRRPSPAFPRRPRRARCARRPAHDTGRGGRLFWSCPFVDGPGAPW